MKIINFIIFVVLLIDTIIYRIHKKELKNQLKQCERALIDCNMIKIQLRERLLKNTISDSDFIQESKDLEYFIHSIEYYMNQINKKLSRIDIRHQKLIA